MQSRAKNIVISAIAISMLVLPLLADRTTLKQGWNLFTVQQDIELGRRLAQQAESSMQVSTDSYANGYIDALGRKLTAHAPGYRYPYQFKILNDRNIEAFAFPGGFVYVSSGLIDAAQTEPQLAGLLAHELAHVVLRHGTQQVSRAYANNIPSAAPGRVPVTTAMNRLNIRFDSDSIVLKHSVESERQADLIATQILRDAAFDPQNMVAFFQTVDSESAGLAADFDSSHPTVPNRAARVRREVTNMGGLLKTLRGDSPDLHTTQARLRDEMARSDSTYDDDYYGEAPDPPSSRMVRFTGHDLEFRHPENWTVNEEGETISIAPYGGIVSGSLAYGMRISTFDPQDGYFGQNTLTTPGQGIGGTTLSRATNQLLDELRHSNPNMTVIRTLQGRRVDGLTGMTVELNNDSPVGGRETDWLVTVLRPNGLLYYFVGAAPQQDYNRYLPTFEQMVASVRFIN